MLTEATLTIGPSFSIEAEGRGRICSCPVWLALWLVVLTAPFYRWFTKAQPALSAPAFAVGVGLYVAASLMLVLATNIEPGTVPRNALWTPPSEDLIGQPLTRSRSQNVRRMSGGVSVLRGVEMRHKFCTTCGVERPIRAVHCRITDRCVEKWDHYCWYMGMTVGRRNHPPYWSFLALALLMTVYYFATGVLALRRLSHDARPESGALVAALAYDPLSCALLLFAAVMGAVLLHLVCLHAHNISVNLTTYEKFRRPFAKEWSDGSRERNPFNLGFARNWTEAFLPLCLPPPECMLAPRQAPAEDETDDSDAALRTCPTSSTSL